MHELPTSKRNNAFEKTVKGHMTNWFTVCANRRGSMQMHGGGPHERVAHAYDGLAPLAVLVGGAGGMRAIGFGRVG